MLAMWIVRFFLTAPRASGKPLKAGPGSKA